MTRSLRTALSILSGVGVGLGYALLTLLAFRADQNSALLAVMSLGFLFVMPFAVGALTVVAAPPELRTSWAYAILSPWLACVALTIVTAALALEAIICLIMAVPILLVMSSFGGVLTCVAFRVQRDARRPQGAFLLTLALLGPYVLTPLEQQGPAPDSLRTVHTQIVIAADSETVWRNIIRVPVIRPEEQGFSAFHLLGLPKPREATLSHEGVGGIRDATFEGGLTFLETVTEWEHQRGLRFTIEVDRTAPLPAPMGAIGGRYFDVLEGSYRMEPLGDGTILLHLDSRERVSTRFNGYAGLWTDFIMADLQGYILRVIKARCEAEARPPT